MKGKGRKYQGIVKQIIATYINVIVDGNTWRRKNERGKGKGGEKGLVGGMKPAMIGRHDAGGPTGSGTSQIPPPLHPSTFPNENTHYSVHFLRAQFNRCPPGFNAFRRF
ncbi:unnamed protein product [Cercopithifilaria johnstoni]|uniref:Uncharacterized protein n=1 Tax=Cercopithifilaria johnstoni TaxID=2874296 RepID=A0A8J2MPK1_9BILA|nr:unnamed protein product [Cercopithifilaria johnstoni]